MDLLGIILGQTTTSCFYSCVRGARGLAGSTSITGRVLSSFLNPKTCPMIPPGFGKGHSLPLARITSASCSLISSVSGLGRGSSALIGIFRRNRRRRPFSSTTTISMGPSARCLGSTGQGMICGSPTTRNEIARVVVKREVVMTERGWRCGGMTGK